MSLLPYLSVPALRRAKLAAAKAAVEETRVSRKGAAVGGLHGHTPGSSCPGPLCQIFTCLERGQNLFLHTPLINPEPALGQKRA